ncbi:sugar transporter ERD6-like 6 [Lathyrus oleraceus]|uniref:sugar transporter ERD6-like 6 n=1 Tax=Pisum sativum TaxID=3888 RepID=UPI0021CEA44B|nr:sugar transporter ERD6-like 6 [Pisum sativum]
MDIEHVPRIKNQEANDLAQGALGYKVARRKLKNLTEVKDKLVSSSVIRPALSMPKMVGAEKLILEIFETFIIDNIANNDWRREIIEFLKNPTGITDQKTKYKALILHAEICLQSVRVQRQNEIPSDHFWSMMMDELFDLDEERLLDLDALMRQKKKIVETYTHVSSDVATFGVGDVQVLATILTLWLADKSGRRLLLIVSSSAMALSLLVVSISFYLKEYISPDSDLYATLSLVSVAGVVVMVIAFSLGLGAMPWIIMSEILPINIKGLAGSFTILANWFFSWLVTLTANLLLDWSSGVCVFTAGFVAIWVPETKGKTLEEIQHCMPFSSGYLLWLQHNLK